MSQTPGMPTLERPHVCPLCEAGCGLSFQVRAGRAVAVEADERDVMSKGFVCPKGLAILDLENDPDRLRSPMRRTATGEFTPISWEEAFDTVASRIAQVQRAHGRDAVAAYTGTVFVHKYGTLLVRDALKSALRTRNWTGVASQDTSARFAAAHMLYGSTLSISVPDIDRTAYLLCIGANPFASNGSMMTAPNVRGRILSIMERGGKVVVVDPRRTETAKAATEHVSIRPGTDAALLLAMVHELVARGQVDLERVQRETRGWPALRSRLDRFSPEQVEQACGVPRATIERLAREFVSAPSSVAYSRMGPGNARHATLACYAVELLNIVAGRLGQVGGSMFPTPAIDLTRLARLTGADGFDRYRSRVRGLPETVGELPATTLAEEIETPGPGQVKALLTYAGNPVLSVPNGQRIARALGGLDFMVSIDIYINETTRYADIILPPAPSLAEDHVDLFFANMAVRNGVRWSSPVVDVEPGQRLDWQILLELSQRLGGGITAIRPVDALLRGLRIALTPSDLANFALRAGPYGDRFLPWSKGLTGARLRAQPHGVDLGPLEPGFRRRVFHRGGRIQLGAPRLMQALDALTLSGSSPPGLLLIGRRDVRSNNSWMHNVPGLMAGKERCVLFVSPLDAARAGVKEGGQVLLESRVHRAPVSVHITDDVREGVVSLPHGYGHAGLGAWQKVAAVHAGTSANDWTDDGDVEAIVGQSILNGVPVTLRSLEASGQSSFDRAAPPA